MGDFEWHDQLRTTDVRYIEPQVRNQAHCDSKDLRRLETSAMENTEESSTTKIEGRSALGFSLTSPDLVCVGSPDIASQRYEESPRLSNGKTINVSLENGIEGSEIGSTFKASPSNTEDLCPEASFELIAPPPPDQENSTGIRTTEIGNNVGPTMGVESDGGLCFSEEGSGEILSEEAGCTHMPLNDKCDDIVEENVVEKELFNTKKLLEELRKENELKSKECEEAWTSLRDLQNELMRKSMHVGSLAFAIEGQVKEKSKWFSSLRDLTRKLKLLKMDHIELSEDASLFKQFLADMDGLKSTVQSTLNQLVQSHEDIKIKFLQEVKERKELYNKVLELKGNIRVFCRCRPLNIEEINGGVPMAVDFEAAKDGELTVKSNGISKKTFKFDAVFSPEADQLDVFEETSPLAMSVLDGYNVCIFAYGQTGTGKTFTMEGTDGARGVNYRTLEKLFDIIEERKNTFKYEVSVSVLEVYNEQIRDLLVSDSNQGSNAAKRLEIKQVGHVPGLVEARVKNVEEVWQALRTGSNGRAVGSTNANEHSSRSHCMHCVMVKGENLLNGESTRSKLWLVDLAGSERIAKTEVQGERLKETQNINRSLSALGDVISALATRSPHIPFRNSRLTHLLQDSLGGDSKTLMFVQISPNENDLSETLCSLNFASRVRGIELGPAKKQMDKTELFKSKQMVEKLKQDLKSKDFQVKKLEDTTYGLEMKLKEKDVKTRSLQDKIKELESQLLIERKLARQHVDSRIAQETEPQRAPLAAKPIITNSESGEFSFFPTTTATIHEPSNEDKENHQFQNLLPRPTGRASLCPTTTHHQKTAYNNHHHHSTQAERRNSLIPLPSSMLKTKTSPFLLPQTFQADEIGCLPDQVACDSPKDGRNKNKRHIGSSALRRSLHKKICMKSPMQTGAKRVVGLNVGLDKVRVSIGSRGRLLGGARRGVGRDNSSNNGQGKARQREKERGWNSEHSFRKRTEVSGRCGKGGGGFDREVLMKDPRRRLRSVGGATDIKRHPFFKGIKWPFIRMYGPLEVEGRWP
ncbi:Di-glucose binding protein with Kinesin motor domain [Striga hermonthica]|uniref:Di-glucose binding protein with Kinesin motor domain n=1 Tax=Striga hermonthica TaxID=68872 RepID=A0A9N7MN37_STRHE|nr:Di-glucose binding protein with Kinesin motor domain [Striga hermonthica]